MLDGSRKSEAGASEISSSSQRGVENPTVESCWKTHDVGRAQCAVSQHRPCPPDLSSEELLFNFVCLFKGGMVPQKTNTKKRNRTVCCVLLVLSEGSWQLSVKGHELIASL